MGSKVEHTTYIQSVFDKPAASRRAFKWLTEQREEARIGRSGNANQTRASAAGGRHLFRQDLCQSLNTSIHHRETCGRHRTVNGDQQSDGRYAR